MQTNDLQRHRIIALALAYLLAQPTLAAETTTDSWMTDRYQVEVIVFRHLDQSRTTPERPATVLMAGSSPQDVYSEADPATVVPYLGPRLNEGQADRRLATPGIGFYLLDLRPEYPDFVTLAEGGKTFDKVYARLQRLDAYEPIVRRIWIQPARPQETAVPFQISAEVDSDLSVTGTIKLFRERYVHLQVELDLTPIPSGAAPTAPADASLRSFGDPAAPPDPSRVTLQTAGAPAFSLHESRRVRSDVAQYYDHPQFGVIALVSKVEFTED